MPPRRSTKVGKRIQQLLEYAGIRILSAIVRILGIETASRLMGWTWRRIGPRTQRQNRVRHNIALAFPDLSMEERERISDAQWDNLGRTFAESFLIDRLLKDRERIDFSGAGAFEQAFNGNRGFVAISLHAGNWEIAMSPISHRFRVVGLYQGLANPLIDAFIVKQRQLVFTEGLMSKQQDTARKAMRFVREGGVIGMLCDTRERQGVRVEFFGQTVTANPFPVMIARRLKVPLFVGRSVRLDGARFEVDGLEVNIPYTDDTSGDVQSAMQAIHRQFELWIRENPGQWMWVQDKWRLKPKKVGRRAA